MSVIMRNPISNIGFINYSATFKTAAIVLAIIVSIILFATILCKKENEENEGFKGFLYNFLNFKTYCIDKVMIILYVLQTLYNLIYGCMQLFINPFKGIMYILVYNIILRVAFELIMLLVDIKKNTDRKCKCHKHDEEFEIIDVNLDEVLDEDNATIIDNNELSKENEEE